MKHIFHILRTILLCYLLTSCQHVASDWVKLETFSEQPAPALIAQLNPETDFIPYLVETHAMNEREYNACLTPGGLSIAENMRMIEDEAVTRTTSVDMITIFKELFSNWHSARSRSYCGSYLSTDVDGNPIRLSGRIVVPLDGPVSRVIVVSHFTIGADIEAPSRSFPLEAIFGARGLAVIIPDYIGFGLSREQVHPYLCAELTAKNVTDMYLAALPFLKSINKSPQHDDIFLFGYSQGGATTVAVQKYMEWKYPEIAIRLNMAGGGPYDPCLTYDLMIEQDETDYPCVIPMMLQGMKVGEHIDNLDLSTFLLPEVVSHMDDWINSKQYVVNQLTQLYGTTHVTDLMTPEAQNKVAEGMSDVYLAMLNNSLVGGWLPQSPIYLFHSIDDNVVPYANAVNLRDAYQGECNITCNFGHYGVHRMAMVRFLYTCMNLMYESGDIDQAMF